MFSCKVIFLLATIFINAICAFVSLANKAEYFIQNVKTKQCLTAGQILESYPNSLFLKGELYMQECDVSQKQMWIVVLHDQGEDIYDLRSSVPSVYNKTDHNVKLAGDLIYYFPNFVHIIQHGQKYQIQDPITLMCWSSQKINDLDSALEEKDCDLSLDNDSWKFILVENYALPKPNCTSFWNCNNQEEKLK